jgi:serine/threonine protein kinase
LLRLSVQVAGALTHMHAAGVVHRDIKSFNVLLNEEGDAHLSDFGLSVYIGDEEEEQGEQQTPPALPSLFASLKQSPCASPVRSPVRSGAPSAAGGVALAIAPPSPFSPHQVNFTPKKLAKHAVPSLPLSRGTHPHQQPDLLRCSPPRLAVPLPAHSPARIRTPCKLDLASKQIDPLATQPAIAPAAANVAVAAPLPPFRRGIARRDRRSFGHLRIYES